MQYISAEEFLKQSEKVRKSILDWWQPEAGDIYCNLYNGQENNVLVINQCQFNFKSFKDDIKKYGIPLLTEGLMRKYIEDKTGRKIEIGFRCNNYIIWLHSMFKGECTGDYLFYDELGNNLLQAYWKVVCNIAEGN